jgi:hypothetical protein
MYKQLWIGLTFGTPEKRRSDLPASLPGTQQIQIRNSVMERGETTARRFDSTGFGSSRFDFTQAIQIEFNNTRKNSDGDSMLSNLKIRWCRFCDIGKFSILPNHR